ncbi:MAG: nitrilase-related carbon-nitrogen hydrolase, partial [Bacteriovoracaceae bacterium]
MNVAIIQICSELAPQKNLEKIDYFIEKAKERLDIEAVFLPEVFYSMSDGQDPTPYLVEPNNEHYANIRNLAIKHKVALVGGSAATKLGSKVINRTYNFDSNGNELAHYDKMHLFSVDLSKDKSKTVIDEATVYTSGNTPQTLAMGPWKIGLSICFDLRFPELFRHYCKEGANLMTIASAFTVPTGKAHWKTLVRARAIENQSYVVAAAQWGQHNEKISTY